MKKGLFFACWLIGYVAVAQEQVTDFKNTSVESLRYVEKVDTINGKLIFGIYRIETGSSNLWVTDGTPENTHLLKDSTGESLDLTEAHLRQYGYVYLKREYIYRTKGETLERVIRNISQLEGFQAFNGKILLYYRNFKLNGTENMNISEFDWLNEDNTRTKWAENVLDYKIVGTTLHYLTFNYQTRVYELCRLTADGVLTKNTLVNQNPGNIDRFQHQSVNGFDYYFFDGDKGRKIVARPPDSKGDLEMIDWGGNSYMPFVVKDSVQNTYFLKHFGSLSVYALSENNQLTKKWDVSIRSIALGDGDIYGNSARYWEFLLAGDKLIFNSTLGGEGINSYFLNVFDLKTGANKKSKNLIDHFRWYYTSLKISVIDTNTYVLDNGVGKKYTYSFLQDSVINITSYPFEFEQIRDSLLVLNQQTVVLAGSIYYLKNGVKTPLIPIKKYYDPSQPEYFQYRIINDRIIYWKYSTVSNKVEVWASKGERKDVTLLLSLNEGYGNWGTDIFQQGTKIYFFTVNEKGGLSFYETDGTAAGTGKVYESPPAYGNLAQRIQANAQQYVVRLGDKQGEGVFIVIKEGKGTLVSFPIRNYYDIYLTRNEIFLTITRDYSQDLYTVKGDTVKLIDKNIFQLSIYEDRIFYVLFVSNGDNVYGLFTTDAADNPVRFLKENVGAYQLFGNKLIYLHYEVLNSSFTLIDLPTNKVEISNGKLLANDFGGYINGALVMRKGSQVLFIKDGVAKEYQVGFNADNGIFAFNKGILLLGAKDITYYDFSTDNAFRILQNQAYNATILVNQLVNDNDYVLLPILKDNQQLAWAYWTLAEKKVQYLDGNITSIVNLDNNNAFSSTSDGTYWYYNGSRLIKKYQLPMYVANKILKYNGHLYTGISSTETETELYQLGTDALLSFPEIVKGSEGIDIRNVFEYNNHVYVYGFTYTYGWQVWKMSEPKVVIIEPKDPLATEPTLENLVIYPNPTQDLLYINTEKTLPYKLINTKGQVLMQGSLSPRQGIDMKQLQSGVYLIQLFEEGRVFVGKVVRE